MKIRVMGKLNLSRRIADELSMWMSVNVGVPTYMLMLLVIVLLFTNGAAAQEPCDAADALLKAQLYDDAQANYTDLLNKYPQLTCALSGISNVTSAQANKSYELGRAYENAGQMDLARDAYIEALKKNQTFTEAQQALKYLPGGNIPYWRDLRSWIGRYGQSLGEIVILLLGVIVLIFRIPWFKSLFEARLNIQDFDNGATELEIGKGMKAIVEESLMRLGKAQLGEKWQMMHLVSGPIDLKIPDIKDAS